ncbi:MAG: tRNA (adenosine(37)-N6)-threonylcarbamoyltransferase complex dimerization subunit type 1 TsaB [Bdellovibrio sp.]|nr:MAG: tRNA (adenosine(37)-N6)-threonylcarbamoyltransferase complex dimerization subunit type 1 TsaB [Bdellovibrio sp.]
MVDHVYQLVLTTSSPHAELAIFKDDQDVFLARNVLPRTHSDWIHVALQEGLAATGLSLNGFHSIALDMGPGSFTGVRVGASLARALGFSLGLPIFAVSSLDILQSQFQSQAQSQSQSQGPSCAMINAYKNKVYFSANRQPAEAIPLEKAASFLHSFQGKLAGDAFQAYPELASAAQKANLLLPRQEAEIYPSAKLLARLAAAAPERTLADWTQVQPLYVRESEPEEKRARSLEKP